MNQQSNNSFSTSTNIRFGSSELKNTWWNVHSVEIPSISMDTPRANSRAGATANMAADTCNFSELNIVLSIDKDWKIYREIYDFFLDGLNVKNAKFSHYKTFDLWVEFVDGQGTPQQKFWFYNCRLMDFGGILVTPNDAEDTHQTMNLSFSVLYYDHQEQNLSKLKKLKD